MADEITIKVPDIGGATHVDVIEILGSPGDEINKDTSLVTLESDKASMEIPSPQAGKVVAIKLKIGDKVSQGDVILTLAAESTTATAPKHTDEKSPDVATQPESTIASEKIIHDAALTLPVVKAEQPATPQTRSTLVSAGPAVRRLASEFGVDL